MKDSWIYVLDSVETLRHMPNTLIYGIFLHSFALLYLYLFYQLYYQISAYASSTGIWSFESNIKSIGRDFRSWRKYFYFPTLFHLSSSDWFIKNLLVIGAIGPLLILTGIHSQMGMAICYGVYLSYANIMTVHFAYPWSVLILELTFLSIWLPTLDPFSLHLSISPSPLHSFSYRLLLWRLMFGFGKFKFVGANWNDWSYLKSFNVMQPFPTPFAWLLYRAPFIIHQFNYLMYFIIEIPMPFLLLFTGWPRLIVCLMTIALQVAIQSVGSYGYFNLLSAVGTIPAFALSDNVFDLKMSIITQSWGSIILHSWLVFMFFIHLLKFPWNSWINNCWVYWPGFSLPAGQYKWIGELLRFLQPWHISAAYGVFAPQSSPPMRYLAVIEGSPDVSSCWSSPSSAAASPPSFPCRWFSFHWKLLHSQKKFRNYFVSPWQTRFEQNLAYESMGMSQHSGNGGNPYEYQHVGTWAELMAWHTLQVGTDTDQKFRHVPFPLPNAPKESICASTSSPLKALRLSLYVYTPSSWSHYMQTGEFYQRFYVGQHGTQIIQDKGLNERFNTSTSDCSRYTSHLNLEPEFWHCDQFLWQLRTEVYRGMKDKLERKVKKGEELTDELVVMDESELQHALSSSLLPILSSDLAEFWSSFISAISSDRQRIIAKPEGDDARQPDVWEHADVYKDSLHLFRLDYPQHNERGWWSKHMYRLINTHPTLRQDKLNGETKRKWEKIMARLVFLLLQRLMSYYHPSDITELNTIYDEKNNPHLPLPARTKCKLDGHIHVYSWYHFVGLCQHVIGYGRSAFLSVLSNPLHAHLYIPSFCAESCLFFQTFFDLGFMAWTAQKVRLMETWMADDKWKINKSFLPGFMCLQYRFLLSQFEFSLYENFPPLPATEYLNAFLFSPLHLPRIHPPPDAWHGWEVDFSGMPTDAPGLVQDEENQTVDHNGGSSSSGSSKKKKKQN